VEVLREVLRDPAKAEGSASASPRRQPILDPYIGKTFEGIAVVTPDGRFRLYTDGLERITGYAAHEIGSMAELGKILVPDPDIHERQLRAYEQAVGQRESDEQLVQIVNRHGERRWLRIRVYKSNEDTLIHALDVTALHTLRTSTPHSAEHYQAVIENLGVGIYSLSDPAEGKVGYLNQTAKRILGIPDDIDELEFSSFMLYESPEDRVALLRALMADGFTRSRTVRAETTLLRYDDRRPVPIRLNITASYDDDGRMTRVDGSFEDLTERKRFEAQRREQELLVSTLFEDTAVGVVVGTLDGHFLAANPAYCTMIGYREDELLGRDAAEFVMPELRGQGQRVLDDAAAAGGLVTSFETNYQHKNGQPIPARIIATAVRNDRGEIVAGIGLVEPLK